MIFIPVRKTSSNQGTGDVKVSVRPDTARARLAAISEVTAEKCAFDWSSASAYCNSSSCDGRLAI